jgi:hypothetical protein
MLLFVHNEMDKKTGEKFHKSCARIVEVATQLQTEINAKPAHPVEMFFVPAGNLLDKYYVEGRGEGQTSSDNRVALTLMLGQKQWVSPKDHWYMPEPRQCLAWQIERSVSTKFTHSTVV